MCRKNWLLINHFNQQPMDHSYQWIISVFLKERIRLQDRSPRG
jgi:hypothetical protein